MLRTIFKTRPAPTVCFAKMKSAASELLLHQYRVYHVWGLQHMHRKPFFPALAVLFFAATLAMPQCARAAVHILNSGAKGDCVTNDAPALNAAIRSLANSPTHSGEVYFPKPPGGCYLVDE